MRQRDKLRHMRSISGRHNGVPYLSETKCLVQRGLVNLFLRVPLAYLGSRELGRLTNAMKFSENSLLNLLYEVSCHFVRK